MEREMDGSGLMAVKREMQLKGEPDDELQQESLPGPAGYGEETFRYGMAEGSGFGASDHVVLVNRGGKVVPYVEMKRLSETAMTGVSSRGHTEGGQSVAGQSACGQEQAQDRPARRVAVKEEMNREPAWGEILHAGEQSNAGQTACGQEQVDSGPACCGECGCRPTVKIEERCVYMSTPNVKMEDGDGERIQGNRVSEEEEDEEEEEPLQAMLENRKNMQPVVLLERLRVEVQAEEKGVERVGEEEDKEEESLHAMPESTPVASSCYISPESSEAGSCVSTPNVKMEDGDGERIQGNRVSEEEEDEEEVEPLQAMLENRKNMQPVVLLERLRVEVQAEEKGVERVGEEEEEDKEEESLHAMPESNPVASSCDISPESSEAGPRVSSQQTAQTSSQRKRRCSSARQLLCRKKATSRGQRKYPCPHCQYRATQAGNLQTHIAAVHDGSTNLLCSQCSYRTCRSNHLKRHMETVHEGLRPHSCPKCGYKAKQKSALASHMEAVHDKRRRFPCPHCPYKASQKGNLQSHVEAIHKQLKKHKCPQCIYRATQKGSLQKHIEAVHAGLRKHSCAYCSYISSQRSNVLKHQRRMHKDQM